MSVRGFDLRVEWSADDEAWVAVFVRDGKPWFLDGALVGMAGSPHGAVEELVLLAQHLVIHGENFLTAGPVPLDDRVWMFSLFDATSAYDDAMYRALRDAGWDGLRQPESNEGAQTDAS